jgi:Short C-terminal domain
VPGSVFGGKKKLFSEGAQTEGVVMRARAVVNPLTVDPGYEVVVRAKFPDGSTTEFTQGHVASGGWLWAQSVGTPFVGQVVPVRYDPSDHSKIAVDLPVLEERLKQAKAAEQAQLDAQVEHLGEPGSQGPGGPAAQALGGLGGGGDLKAQLLQMAAQNAGSVIDLRSSQPQAESASDPVDRLAKLAAMKDQGLLSDAEFAAAKAKILGES